MSNYTKTTNFAVKDGYTTGNPNKVVKGTEIDDEFNAIASAISSKADTASPTFTGTPAAPTAVSGTNTTQIATTAFVTSALTEKNSATETFTNKTISVDNNTISGIAASSFILSNASGNIDGSAAQKAIPSGNVVGTTDTQTLTNKTIDASQLVNGTITPEKLNGGQSGSAPIYGARAWVNFNGTGTVAIRESGNVSSITDNGTGDYTVNFTSSLSDSNYSVSLACRNEVSGGDLAINIKEATTLNTSNFRIQCSRFSDGNRDPSIVCVSVFR